MIGRTKYISIFISGLFIFPVIFQSFHFMHHHAPSHKTNGICQFDESEGRTCHTSSEIILSEHADCFVCEYQFVLVKLPEETDLEIASITTDDKLIIPKYTLEQQGLFSKKSPRAPPMVLNSLSN